MSEMQITEETPSKMVLEKNISADSVKWHLADGLVSSLVFLVITLFGLLFFESRFPSWLRWIIAIGVCLITLPIVVRALNSTFTADGTSTAVLKITIILDLQSSLAVRVEKLFNGTEKKEELRLDQISQVSVVEEGHGWRTIRLEAPNNLHLWSCSDSDYHDRSLESIGNKIGRFLKKPVVFK